MSNARFTGAKTGQPGINEDIRVKEVLLIDDEGTKHGVVQTSDALKMAYDKGLDLVIVSPNQSPPVAKIIDYGKYKFEAEKKAREAKKKQHVVEVKEIKMRYKIDSHDYNVKLKNIQKFLASGNKVKVLIMMRGRESQHSELAFKLMKRVEADLQDEPMIMEKKPSMDGKNVLMILAPAST